MPSVPQHQQRAASLAASDKAGRVPSKNAKAAAQNMTKMPFDTIKNFIKMKESLSLENKKKLLYGLKLLKKKVQQEWTTGNVGGETDIGNPDNALVNEETPNTERNVVAKTFPEKGGVITKSNQDRGVQFAPKEIETINNFKKVITPTANDPWVIRYETTDGFGDNKTTVIKKHQQGNQFCFTAYTKHDKGYPEPKEEPKMPQKPPAAKGPLPQQKGKSPTGGLSKMPQQPTRTSMPVTGTPKKMMESDMPNDQIIVTKTIPFTDEIEGADILADFLRTLKSNQNL